MGAGLSLAASPTSPRPLEGLVGLEGLVLGTTIQNQDLGGPMKLSGWALYDDGQMINSNVINNVTKEPLG